MSESYEESQQRISNQRAENLMSAHKRIGELKGEIEELQRQNAMLVEAASAVIKSEMVEEYMVEADWEPLYWNMYKAISATSAQSAAWLEASHIEWMKGLPIARYLYRYQTQDRSVVEIALRGSEEPTESIALYAIPTKKD